MKNEISIPDGKIQIKGNLVIPDDSNSIVIFSHGSGSGRFSPRNNYVASVLNRENITTLLIDLLTPAEDELFENRFNIDLLTERMEMATDWVHQHQQLKNFSIGYFGASTGAAAALQSAITRKELVDCVVSRGGRPDLAGSIWKVKAPTLLIVGGLDDDVIELNKEAYSKLQCEKKLDIVENASHLFEEPGKLEEVAKLSTDWFKKHLTKSVHAPG